MELLAQVTPLSPAAKVIGVGLGIVVAGVVFVLWPRRVPQGGAEPADPSLPRAPDGSAVRRPALIVALVCGILVAAGVLVDPRTHPRAFVGLWVLVCGLVAILLFCAGYDLFIVRRRALHERARLVRSNRERLEDDLRCRRGLAAAVERSRDLSEE